jgi:hypothetical protein
MNLITELYWTIKWKIEDALYAIKDILNKELNKEESCDPFVGEEYITDMEQKPKKKKSKKKSVKKVKKSL